MSRVIIALSIGTVLLAPVAAHADIMSGSFTGTMESGTDVTNVFGGGDNSDLSTEAITGTFTYDSSDFTPSAPVSTTASQLYTGTSGSLSVTITIGGSSYTFDGGGTSTVYLDPTSNSEVELVANDSGQAFTLDVAIPDTPFISTSSLTGTYSGTALDDSVEQNSVFSIDTISPAATVNDASFNVDSISVTDQSTATPEPASMAVLAVGLAGIAAVRRRRAKS